ncbi:MAG TPA: prepilin-type N-terminal cleavage/methylation domain-containing protein [Tepidisphaeraceae bacterium]|jgi:prepilin-type N-terminal cleavage/methylation domain-containing protein/prepilin-type processing-associated H-X9-DG protein|nr:prepilin-type N-terminal cleavage/methylation domain-containing protein [Tepidisphaeraceae bacterium]
MQHFKTTNSRQNRAQESGFTLVELLVVIGIIALLISILLPSLSKARKQANTVKCASNMRQIGACFLMYAQDNKGKWPVTKYDLSAPYPQVKVDGGTNPVNNYYWWDFLTPYAFKPAYPVQAYLNSVGGPSFKSFRDSVFWGCPNWDGQITAIAAWTNGGVSIYESGYIFNMYPSYEPNYPLMPGAVPSSEAQMWSPGPGNAATNPNTQSWVGGKWWPQTKWSKPSERCLVTEGLLWLMYINPRITPATAVQPQGILAPSSRTALYTGNSAAGTLNVDRYRHSRYPVKMSGDYYNDPAAPQAFNMLFADGHVSLLTDIKRAFDAITMRPMP